MAIINDAAVAVVNDAAVAVISIIAVEAIRAAAVTIINVAAVVLVNAVSPKFWVIKRDLELKTEMRFYNSIYSSSQNRSYIYIYI